MIRRRRRDVHPQPGPSPGSDPPEMRTVSSPRLDTELEAIGLIARSSPDYVLRFFELLERGAVVVPLRSREDRYRVDACGVGQIVEPRDGHGWVTASLTPRSDAAIAQVAFTSGTEGEPKGILLTHGNLDNTVRRLRDVMRLDASIREYIGVPVHHSFGFGRCRAVASLGGRFYLPESGFNPREIADLLRSGEINAISAVPSLWRIAIRSRTLFEDCGHRVRWIEIGSQPMPAHDKLVLRELFPNARIVQHYGLTEASRTTFLEISSASFDELESVGRPNGDVEVAITENGRIKIRGGNVAAEILVDGRRTPNTDREGWLETSDLGELRGGNLYFLGRADEIINLAGVKVSPAAIEERLRATLATADALCVARIPDPARGDGVLLAAREDLAVSDPELVDAAASALQELGIEARSSLFVSRFAALPMTDSGKVQRRALAEQYQQRRAQAVGSEPEAEGSLVAASDPYSRRIRPHARSVRSVFAKVFPHSELRDRDTFASLGGDSLTFIEASIELEEILGSLPESWQDRSIGELEALPRRRTLLHAVDMALFIRCVGIVAIVFGHFGVLNIGGATYLLLVVAGLNFARFQLGTVAETGSVRPILATAGRIAAPTALALAVLQVKTGYYDLPQLLLLGNWRDAMTQKFGFWFLELIVQVLAIVALLFLLPAARRWGKSRPFEFGMGVLLVSAAIAGLSPLLWDVEPLFYRVPHMLMWLFALGWVLQAAVTPAQKACVAGLAVLLPLALWAPVWDRFWLQYGAIWIPAGCWAFLSIDRIRLPAPLHKVVAWIAGASMFIYLMHYTGRSLWHRFGPVQHVLIDALVGILVGIAAWLAWEAAIRLAEKVWRQRAPRVSGFPSG